MRLLVMRHGETDANKEGIMSGRSDISLNGLGRDQSEKAAELLKDLPISAIYSSPLNRSVETAEIIQQYHKDVEIWCRDSLNEWNAGLATGISHNDIRYHDCQNSIFERYPEGESRADIIARVYPFIDSLIREYVETACLLIITHGDICKIIDTYFYNASDLEVEAGGWGNCEIREYWGDFS